MGGGNRMYFKGISRLPAHKVYQVHDKTVRNTADYLVITSIVRMNSVPVPRWTLCSLLVSIALHCGPPSGISFRCGMPATMPGRTMSGAATGLILSSEAMPMDAAVSEIALPPPATWVGMAL